MTNNLECKILNVLKHLTIILIILTNLRHFTKFFKFIFKIKIYHLYDFISRDIFIFKLSLNRFNWFLYNRVYGSYYNYLNNKYF